jgi:hypothetical protein
MKIQIGNLAEECEPNDYIILPVAPKLDPGKIRLTGFAKALDQKNKLPLRGVEPDYNSIAGYIYYVRSQVLFLLPTQPLKPNSSEVRDKWKHQKLVNPPNWKLMSSIEHMTPFMIRISELARYITPM